MTLTSRLLLARRLMNGLRNKPRRGFTLIELLVVVVIIGILASVALPSFIGAQDKARNASVAANINTVRMGLEQYGTDNNGSYPGSSGFMAAMTTSNYLPGNRMPKAPWSSTSQTTIGVPGSNCGNVQSIADGTQSLSSVGTTIGSGTVNNPPASTTEYGFIAYDYAPTNQVYVVYGTGKKNKTAVVAGATSNGSN